MPTDQAPSEHYRCAEFPFSRRITRDPEPTPPSSSMPPSKYSCPVCNAPVVRKHLRQHLEKSLRPECQKYLHNQLALELSSDEEVAPASRSSKNHPHYRPASTGRTPSIEPVDAIQVDPLGDYFGDYADMDDMAMPVDLNITQRNSTLLDDESYSENEELENEADDAEVESSLELDRPGAPVDTDTTEPRVNFTDQPDDPLLIHTAPEPAHATESSTSPPAAISDPEYAKPHVVAFGGLAGCPVSSQETSNNTYQSKLPTTNIYHPFNSQIEWEIARWAKLHGHISASAVTELLSIKGVTERLGLTFKNSNELNKVIDDQLPSVRPPFQQVPFELEGEVFEVFFRDVVACVEALFGDPEFAPYLKYAPEQHFTDESCTIRLYHDMHTGEWWWATQEDLDAVKPGGTIIPIILSSDKTQLTLFRNKSAYPLYMTIGNIPKEMRRRPSCRAYVLLAYLPTSRLLHISNQAARRRCLLNVYHSCMSKILSPLKEIGLKGRNMANGDGIIRRTHLLYASFIGDYPEQVQATCVITGDCVGCPAPHSSLGNYDRFEAADSWRPLNDLLDAIDALDDDPLGFQRLAKERRVKPVDEPFWKDLPFAHIYRSITPDVLHQLYQGLVKHVVGWVTEACGAAEIDARCRRLPPNHNTHIFLKGITSLSRVSGKEHAAMCQILLGLLTDIRLPNGVSIIPLQRAVRALLDFVYLAQYPVHTTGTLCLMEDALEAFHNNKHIFVTLGIREHFNIPKLHFASHYARCIKLFGTTDNFNTEYTERLHIDLAKDAYRATNHKDEFSQMVRWLERKEKMSRHAQHIEWRLSNRSNPHSTNNANSTAAIWNVPSLDRRRFLKMAKRPTCRSVSLDKIKSPTGYGAIHFLPALYRFAVICNNPNITTRRQLDREVEGTFLFARYLPVWHSIKYLREDPITHSQTTADIIHAHPEAKDGRGRCVPARFDTALVNEGSGKENGLQGRRVGRIRVIFSLPEAAIEEMFDRPAAVPEHLVYIEWFTPFQRRPDSANGLHKISKSLLPDGTVTASVVPLSYIFRSVHLFPKFGPVAATSWTSSNVLDKCSTFYLNPFTDRHLFTELQLS